MKRLVFRVGVLLVDACRAPAVSASAVLLGRPIRNCSQLAGVLVREGDRTVMRWPTTSRET